MNADQLKGKWRQFQGGHKQQYGKFTDDAMQQIKGIDDIILGKVQERYGNGKDAFMKGNSSAANSRRLKPQSQSHPEGKLSRQEA